MRIKGINEQSVSTYAGSKDDSFINAMLHFYFNTLTHMYLKRINEPSVFTYANSKEDSFIHLIDIVFLKLSMKYYILF